MKTNKHDGLGPQCATFRRLSPAILLAVWAQAMPLMASEYHIWDGSSSANWSVGANWIGNIAPVAGDILIFPPAATRYVMTNNFAAGTEFILIFAGTDYIARGNRINLPATADPGIIATNSSGNNTVALDLALSNQKTIECTRVGGALTVSGAITGGLRTGLTKDGPGTLTLSGTAANTFPGLARVLDGTLLLNKSGGDAVPGLSVTAGALARLLADNQIGGSVTVDSGGLLELNNHSDIVTSITLNGGEITTGTGTLTLSGNLTASSSASTAATLSGILALADAAHRFDVADGPLAGDFNLFAVVSGPGGFSKTNGGVMFLASANSFSGPVAVDAGTLTLSNALALGSSVAGTTVNSTGTLIITNCSVSGETLLLNEGELAASGLNAAWSPTVTLSGAARINVLGASSRLSLGGALIGTGSLTKLGPGTLITTGSAANTYSGLTWVDAGTLEMSKSSGYALNNHLTVGNSGGSNATASVKAALQIPQTINITNHPNGTLALNGYSHTLGPTFFLGGRVDVGAGTLTFAANPVVIAVSNKTSTIFNGTLMAGSTLTLNAIGHYPQAFGPQHTPPDLWINSAITGAGGITKMGSGHVKLSGANTFTGQVTIQSGAIIAASSQALGQTTSGTVVQRGSLAFDSCGTIANESLLIQQDSPASGYDGALISLFGANTWSGPVTFDHTVNVITYVNGNSLTLSGPVGGAGGLAKWGYGDLILSGTAANTYTGGTWVHVGKLRLAKTLANAAVPGDVVMYYYPLLAGSYKSILEVATSEQIANSAQITINDSNEHGYAYLDLVGAAEETIGYLAGGGEVHLNDGRLIVDGANPVLTSFGGRILGTGASAGLTKHGASIQSLGGYMGHTYPGQTRVEGGTLLLYDDLTSSPVLVLSGGILGGSWAGGPVITVNGGILSPGSSPGVLTCGTLALDAASRFEVDLDGLTPGGVSGYDQMQVSTGVNLGGATLKLRTGVPLVPGSTYTVIQNNGAGPVTNTFAGLPNNTTFAAANGRLRINYDGGTGNDVVLTVTEAAPAAPLHFTSCTHAAGQVWLTWAGGWPLFTVEHRTNLSLGGWQVVMPPAAVSNFSHTPGSPAGFYRVRSGN